MQKLILIIFSLFLFQNESFSQASSVENLKRATAKEVGNNTRTEEVIISNIKRKATSVKWTAKINDTCYECDADDMVRNIHIVKIDCSLIPVEQPTSGSTNSGPKDPLGAAIHKKIQEDKAKREGLNTANQNTNPSAATTSSPPQSGSKSNTIEDPIEQLRKWKKLLDEGVINQQEFDAQKKKLLDAK